MENVTIENSNADTLGKLRAAEAFLAENHTWIHNDTVFEYWDRPRSELIQEIADLAGKLHMGTSAPDLFAIYYGR